MSVLSGEFRLALGSIAVIAFLVLPLTATAQSPITVTPSSVTRSLSTGGSEVQILSVSNQGKIPLDYTITFTGDRPDGIITDSIAFDPGELFGMINLEIDQPPLLSAAVRFTVDRPFEVSAVRAFLPRSPHLHLRTTATIHRITNVPPGDEDDTILRLGPIAASGVHVQPLYVIGDPTADLVGIPLNRTISFEPGEEFYILLHFDPPQKLPAGIFSATQDPDVNGRAFYLPEGRDWTPLGRRGVARPYDAVWMFRALSGAGAWLVAEPVEGSLPPGSSDEVMLTFNAAKLQGGTYEGLLTFETTVGDPVDVTATLNVTPAPVLSLAPDRLDFGTLQAGVVRTDSIRIENAGAAALTVDLIVDGDGFSVVDGERFELESGARRHVAVRFAPTSNGTFNGNLTILSNDTANPMALVPLSGAAENAPAFSVEPAALTARLRTEESETQTLTVANTGDGELRFTLGIVSPPFSAGKNDGPMTVPEGVIYADSLFVDDPGASVTEWAFEPPVAVSLNPSNAFTLTAVRAHLPDVSAVTVEVYPFTEHNNPTAAPSLYSGTIDVPEGGPMKELPLGVSLPFEANERFWIVLRPVDRQGRIGATEGSGLSYYRHSAGVWIQHSHIWVIRALSGTGGELFAASPREGIVAPGGEITVEVTFSTAGVLTGTYERNLVFISNDPVNESLTIPATLIVEGLPLLSLDVPELDFGEVFLGFPDTLGVTVRNTGAGLLEIDAITVTGPDFSVIPGEGFSLPPSGERLVRVAYAPSSEGSVTGSLSFESNDGENPVVTVALSGTGVQPPAIVVEPGSLSAELTPGGMETQHLTLRNDGPGDLDFAFAVYDEGARRFGGAEVYGYRWFDSNQLGGPFFDWVDIRSTGTPLGLVRHDVRKVVLPFEFPFYGELFDTLYVYSHGVMSFQPVPNPVTMWFPEPLPSTKAPNGIIAPLWLELAPEAQGEIYTGLDDRGRFVVTFHEVRGFWQDDSYYTFQAILSPDGTILYQYDDIQGIRPHRASIGIESSDGATGLSVAFREAYAYSGLAVQISARPAWITHVSPTSGTIGPGMSLQVETAVNAGDLPGGSFTDHLVIVSNDPVQPGLRVPVSLTVDGRDAVLQVRLDEGWNLFSTNLQPIDASPEAVLGDVLDRVEIAAVQRYGAWQTWKPSAPAEDNSLQEIDPRYSYWIKMAEPATIMLAGSPVDPQTQISLGSGLNSIAYLPRRADVLGHALGSVMEHTIAAMSFRGTGIISTPSVPEDFRVLTQMQPHSGYVLSTTSSAVLVYPESSGGLDEEPGEIQRPTLRSIIAAEREAGVAPTTEWVGVWGQDITLPNGSLLPSGTLVTAITGDGVTVGAFRTVAEGRLGLMSIYRDDPFTTGKNGAAPGETVSIRAGEEELARITWTAFGDVVDVSGSSVDSEPIAGEELPREYTLDQNYPNPFNPQTVIRFALPAAGPVTLRVYDALGRMVTTLVEGERAAGRHEVTWDANLFAGGVYFYRLQTGNFSITRQMVLLK